MITAIAPAMVTAYIPMKQKGKAMGIIMTVAALGTAIGPTIGGVLTQYLSWHWIFLINVPVGFCAILLGAKVIPTITPHDQVEGFDKAGALLIFTGLAALLFAVSEGNDLGWTSPVILGTFALAIVTLAYFVWHELGISDPLLELRLFKNRNFLMTNLVMSLVFFSFAGINYLLPFYLEYVKGYGASDAGLILTSLSVAMMISGLLAGALYNRVGGRNLCIVAGIFLVAGYYMMTLLRVDTTNRICYPLPRPAGIQPWPDDNPGIEYDHEFGSKEIPGHGLQPHQPRTVRPPDSRHCLCKPGIYPGYCCNCRAPRNYGERTGKHQTGSDYCGF